MINMLAAFRADNMKRAEQAGNEITQQQHGDMGIKLRPKTALARASIKNQPQHPHQHTEGNRVAGNQRRRRRGLIG